MRQSHYAPTTRRRGRCLRPADFTLQTGARTTANGHGRRHGHPDGLGACRDLPYWDLYVRATNAGGASAWAEASVYNDSGNLYPRQPTGVQGRRTATGTATLNWDAVTGAADYRVYFDFPADDLGTAGWDWLPYRDVAVTVTGTAATVSGLPAMAAHWGLRVTALNGHGAESVRSAALAVSTATAPAAPAALRAAPGADSQCSWPGRRPRMRARSPSRATASSVRPTWTPASGRMRQPTRPTRPRPGRTAAWRLRPHITTG